MTLKGYHPVLFAMRSGNPTLAIADVEREAAELNRRLQTIGRDPVGALVYFAYRQAIDDARELRALGDSALEDDIRRTAKWVREVPQHDDGLGRLAVGIAERRRRAAQPAGLLPDDFGAARSALLAAATKLESTWREAADEP